MFTTLHRRAGKALVATTLALFVLAACGTTEDAGSSSSAGATVSSGPVDVRDERGTVHLEAPAADVVSLEWGLTETLLALGVKPVGAADVKGYNQYDKSAPLAASTPDVGQRGTPSLDAIVALKPDLVVTTTDLPKNVVAQIEKTAPVIALRGSDATDPIAYLRKTVNTLAEATGTEAAGKKLLSGFDAKVTEGQQALAKAGKAGAPFTMSDGWVQSGTVAVRMYTPGSFLGAIGKELGLTNQWTGGGDKDYGLAQTDIEGLTKVTNAGNQFLYVADVDSDDGKAFVSGLTGNAVWKQLAFVKTGKNVHRIADGVWMFGSTPSAERYVDSVVDALTGA